MKHLSKSFPTPKDAHAHYSPFVCQPSVPLASSKSSDEAFSGILQFLVPFEEKDQLNELGRVLEQVALRKEAFIPSDYLPLPVQAMENLRSSERSNLYNLAKAISTLRNDGSEFAAY